MRSGAVNSSGSRSSRSWVSILRANVLTRFNALLGGLLVVILVVGPLQDALLGIILVVNTAIGILQEARARRTLDHLALLHEPRARVARDGRSTEIRLEEVVLGGLLQLARGDQIVADGVVLTADCLEIVESLLTGEAEPVAKAAGDGVLSGSAVAAGAGLVRASTAGSESFAQVLASEARRSSLVHSELQSANNRIMQLLTWAIVPVAGLLCWSQLSGRLGFADAVRGSVAGAAATCSCESSPPSRASLGSMAAALGVAVLLPPFRSLFAFSATTSGGVAVAAGAVMAGPAPPGRCPQGPSDPILRAARGA